MKDLELWQAMKNGDQNALKTIYDGNASALMRYGKRFQAHSDLLKDCLHDLFVYIWTNRSQLSDTDAIGPYLTVAFRRRIINALKASSKIANREMDLENVEFGLLEETALEREEATRVGKAKITRALATLSDRQREVIYLKYYRGMGYEDIAEAMDINYQSVRNLVHNGLRKLRNSGMLEFITLFIFLL
ncbi:MAG: sigma-70 family RNA polymerase sigma factor [Saprospiraceae bacterium]|nr:sigma-70 family RNA polymerase sigma factor [Saprospiraceae bacterium]